MNYTTKNSMPEAVAKEKQFTEFFRNVKAIIRQCDIQTTIQKWVKADYDLNEVLLNTQVQVHTRLADNFDTPGAIQFLSELVTAVNTYVS